MQEVALSKPQSFSYHSFYFYATENFNTGSIVSFETFF